MQSLLKDAQDGQVCADLISEDLTRIASFTRLAPSLCSALAVEIFFTSSTEFLIASVISDNSALASSTCRKVLMERVSISSPAFFVLSESFRISEATTANPFPSCQALAASTAAFNAKRLV